MSRLVLVCVAIAAGGAAAQEPFPIRIESSPRWQGTGLFYGNLRSVEDDGTFLDGKRAVILLAAHEVTYASADGFGGRDFEAIFPVLRKGDLIPIRGHLLRLTTLHLGPTLEGQRGGGHIECEIAPRASWPARLEYGLASATAPGSFAIPLVNFAAEPKRRRLSMRFRSCAIVFEELREKSDAKTGPVAVLEVSTHFLPTYERLPTKDVVTVKGGDYIQFQDRIHRVVRVTPRDRANGICGWVELDVAPTAQNQLPAGATLVKPKQPY